jgi:hypothetical protein
VALQEGCKSAYRAGLTTSVARWKLVARQIARPSCSTPEERVSVKASDIPDGEILQLIDQHTRFGGAFAYEVLIAAGYPEKVVYAKYEKLSRRGLIDWGVSMRTGWLTDKGKALLLHP